MKATSIKDVDVANADDDHCSFCFFLEGVQIEYDSSLASGESNSVSPFSPGKVPLVTRLVRVANVALMLRLSMETI